MNLLCVFRHRYTPAFRSGGLWWPSRETRTCLRCGKVVSNRWGRLS